MRRTDYILLRIHHFVFMFVHSNDIFGYCFSQNNFNIFCNFFFAFFFGKDIKKNRLKCFWATGCHYIFFVVVSVLTSNYYFKYVF